MQSDLPLAYGVPSASTGFLQKLEQEKAGPSGAAPAPAEDLVARRRRADSQSLGDFISFDELSYEAPAAEPAEPTRRPAAQRAELWSTARRYDGPSALLRLHEELLDFAHAFKPTRAETTARSDLVSRVRDVVSSVWPAAEIRCFGSYDTGLWLPESDIDLVCLNTGVPSSQKLKGRALHRLGEALRRAPWRATQLEVVDKARVPIVKFVDGATGVAVDICLEELTGLQSSALARKALAKFPQYGPLVLVLKRWLNARGLHDTYHGGVGSYLLQLLVIASLQHPPAERKPSLRGNLGSCVLHFLELFGLRLNYEAVGISVADGGAFFSKAERRVGNTDRPGLICVLNPLDTTHDVGANSYNIGCVRRAWSHCYVALVAALDDRQVVPGAAGRRLQVLSALMDCEAEMSARFEQHALDGSVLGGAESLSAKVGAAPTDAAAGKRKRGTPEADAAVIDGGGKRRQRSDSSDSSFRRIRRDSSADVTYYAAGDDVEEDEDENDEEEGSDDDEEDEDEDDDEEEEEEGSDESEEDGEEEEGSEDEQARSGIFSRRVEEKALLRGVGRGRWDKDSTAWSDDGEGDEDEDEGEDEDGSSRREKVQWRSHPISAKELRAMPPKQRKQVLRARKLANRALASLHSKRQGAGRQNGQKAKGHPSDSRFTPYRAYKFRDDALGTEARVHQPKQKRKHEKDKKKYRSGGEEYMM